jgi:mannitol-1-/sugar-/sorbitol-6-phosphatase
VAAFASPESRSAEGLTWQAKLANRVVMTMSGLPDRVFAAFLFDMDGTIINSIEAAERAWAAWARRHGLDVETFLPTIHGVRGIETISRLQLPGLDPHAEAREILLAEIADIAGVRAIAGAARFLTSLPEDRWAIVTSAPRELAVRRLEAAGLPHPHVFITSEDVEHGKPAPDCFLLAAQRLGRPIEKCLVFEDAPAGIRAAEAAGASIVVVTATHKHLFETDHRSILGYEALVASRLMDGGLRLGPA